MRTPILMLAGLLLGIAGRAQSNVSIPTSDGGVIVADLYGHGDKGLVLAHGGQFNKESWRPQAEQLAAAGFHVLAFDFRSYGKSHGPGDKDIYTAPLHLDVLAAVRYLHSVGARTVSIVGASLGGGAAGDASMAAAPGEIDRLVFLGSAPNGPADKLKSPSLFLVARDDTSGEGLRLPGIPRTVRESTWPEETCRPRRLRARAVSVSDAAGGASHEGDPRVSVFSGPLIFLAPLRAGTLPGRRVEYLGTSCGSMHERGNSPRFSQVHFARSKIGWRRCSKNCAASKRIQGRP
ncbi:alpha/beta hydrolase [Acidobacteria bacterium AB60]|nr:alpha/beta hydrolase [Acidobacteria bacterium AB60]